VHLISPNRIALVKQSTETDGKLVSARSEYQERRYALLSSTIDTTRSIGLEIGASDLPTVREGLGECRYADFRTRDEMIAMWGLVPDSVCPVDYVLSRDRSITEQISDRFDYVIACHVLEHIPDPISYLNGLKSLLFSGAGKVIFISLPDKRATLDKTRPSTTVEQLLGYKYLKARYPSFQQIMEFHRHWVGYSNGKKPLQLSEAFDYAVSKVQSSDADAHCHVWQDDVFHDQVRELIAESFLPGLEIAHFERFYLGTNEFTLILRTV